MALVQALIQGRNITPRSNKLLSIILLLGFAVSVLLRLSVGGAGAAQSSLAGLVFAGFLIALSVGAGLGTRLSRKAIIIGIFGGVFLCVPAFFAHSNGAHPYGSYLNWAIVVSIVALAEEAFFRGVLFEAVQKWRGETAAILIAAAAFAALHIPLYGWHVVPLDFTVGVWLGALRAVSGSWVAPGISHTLADLAGWWII
jgi:membrane protease YdiL (CAAX protease family)